MIKNKKGIQLNEAFTAVLTVVLVAVLIIVAIYMFGALGSTFTHATVTSVNEPDGSWINSTGYQLSEYAADRSLSNVVVIDTDDNSTVAANLYTINGTWYIFNATETTLTQIDITYDYSIGTNSAAYNATNDTIDQFATYPALIGLVGTIIFLGIVIGVLVMSFMPKENP